MSLPQGIAGDDKDVYHHEKELIARSGFVNEMTSSKTDISVDHPQAPKPKRIPKRNYINPMVRAMQIVERYRQRGNVVPKLLSSNLDNLARSQEHKDAKRIYDWKQAIRGVGKSRCSDDVKAYLDEHMPTWNDNNPRGVLPRGEDKETGRKIATGKRKRTIDSPLLLPRPSSLRHIQYPQPFFQHQLPPPPAQAPVMVAPASMSVSQMQAHMQQLQALLPDHHQSPQPPLKSSPPSTSAGVDQEHTHHAQAFAAAHAQMMMLAQGASLASPYASFGSQPQGGGGGGGASGAAAGGDHSELVHYQHARDLEAILASSQYQQRQDLSKFNVQYQSGDGGIQQPVNSASAHGVSSNLTGCGGGDSNSNAAGAAAVVHKQELEEEIEKTPLCDQEVDHTSGYIADPSSTDYVECPNGISNSVTDGRATGLVDSALFSAAEAHLFSTSTAATDMLNCRGGDSSSRGMGVGGAGGTLLSHSGAATEGLLRSSEDSEWI